MGTVPEKWAAHGCVTIEYLVASYDAHGGREPVLRGVSLDIPAGAKVGVYGRSGSGKSLLLGCILRLLEVGPGSRITIDGRNIMTLPRQAAVAVVPQHPFVSLDSPLGADRLSQGHRQPLCIARAMLADKWIILINETSSIIDGRSERLIRDFMREQFAICTIIAAAHRLVAVVDFDCVAVMGGGRLLEWDRPCALLQRHSEFKKLWDLAAGSGSS
ncbi:P-loop containing nucleoside triphosphate hydrolase protein [Aspergillus navahoensis]